MMMKYIVVKILFLSVAFFVSANHPQYYPLYISKRTFVFFNLCIKTRKDNSNKYCISLAIKVS